MSYKDVMYNEEEIYQSEFNLMRVISMKEQIEESLKLDFEILLELLNSSDHVCQNYSSTVKSLMMLCFNNLVSTNYRKVYAILNDTINLFDKIDFGDYVYLKKVKAMEKCVRGKLQ